MPQNLANFDNAMKNNYGPGLRNGVNNSNVIAAAVAKNTEDIMGRKAVWSVHSGRSASTLNVAEGGTLPTADRERYIAPEDSLVWGYHTIKVSGQSHHLSQGKEGAFLKALEGEVTGAGKAIRNDYARQLFGQKLTDGTVLKSGVIAVFSADPSTGTTWTFANTSRQELRAFFKGMTLAVINPSDGSVRAGGPYVVSSVSLSAKTVEITAASNAAIASGDYVVRCNSASTATNAFGQEINGLRHLVHATQTYAGINPSTEPTWAASEVGSSTTPISEVLLDEANEVVELEGSGDSPNVWLVAETQRRKLAAELNPLKRYDAPTKEIVAGWTGLAIAQGALFVDKYCPETDGFGLTTKEIERFVGLDFTWDEDGDGRTLWKAMDGTDAIEGRMKVYHNFEAVTRNAHVHLTLSAPTF